MRCVVLAAGCGSRLGRGRPKPLEPVCGLALVERVVATAARVGVDDFFVVTGYEAEQVEAFVADLALRRRLCVTSHRNDRWPAGNGTSALTVRELVEGEFLLLMGDHVFDEDILRGLVDQRIEPGGVVVAADLRVGAEGIAVDSDATKLLVEGERVREIGKDLERYNAYDTGAFLCTPSLFEALAVSTASGDGSLSGGVRRLAHLGGVRAFDIRDAHWVDVDTAADARRARVHLRASLPKAEDGVVSRLLNRRVSGRVVTPTLLRLWPRVTANEVSVLGFGVALLAAACFLADWPVLAGVGIALASILDGSDGEIARLKQLRSSFGAYLDAVLDRYADTALLAAATVYAWRTGGDGIAVAAGVAAGAGNVMVSYTSARSLVDLAYRYRGRWLAAGRGRDLRLLVLSMAAVLSPLVPVAVSGALILLALLTNGVVVARLVLSWRLTRPSSVAGAEAVVFDLDGTVADTMPFLTDLAVELLGRYGLTAGEARSRYLGTVGIDFASQLEELFPCHPTNREVAAEFETRKGATFLRCRVFPDVTETLTLLHRAGVQRFLCSSTTRELVTAYLCAHGLNDDFDDYAGFEPGRSKDRQLELLVEQHGLSRDRVLFVGDAPRDAELLRRTGVHFIGVHRVFPADQFRHRGLHSVDDLAALTRLWEGDTRRRRAVAPTTPSLPPPTRPVR